MKPQQMKFAVLALGGIVGHAMQARAEVPQGLRCSPTVRVNCVEDGILILEGTPDLVLQCKDGSIKDEQKLRTNCLYDEARVAEKAAAVLQSSSAPGTGPFWDQLAIFYADSDEPAVFGGPTAPMLFYRAPKSGTSLKATLGDPTLRNGVNKVGGIGQAVTAKNPAFPFTGFVRAGSSTTFGKWQGGVPGGAGIETSYRNCNLDALCNDGMGPYQALAQATGQMFGPFLKPEPGLEDDSWYSMSRLQRSSCSPMDPSGGGRAIPLRLVAAQNEMCPTSAATSSIDPPGTGTPFSGPDLSQESGLGGSNPPRGPDVLSVCPDNKITLTRSVNGPAAVFDVQTSRWSCPAAGHLHQRIRPRIWNSFIDMDTSLMGGVNWEENGNGTASNAAPAANTVASWPYGGQRLAAFHPLELWLMGLLPESSTNNSDGVPRIPVYQVSVPDLLGFVAGFGNFPRNAGPRSGPPKLTGIGNGAHSFTIRSDRQRKEFGLADLIGVAPARTPAFANAPHVFKQLWVVVTKPHEYERPEWPGSTCPIGQVCERPEALAKINAASIALVKNWRKTWQQQWYMLTSYRGKMVSGYDSNIDETPYWEFMQEMDDKRSFVAAGGLAFAVSGPQADTNTPNILSYMNVQTPGATGALTFTPHENQPPISVDGQPGAAAAINSFLVRLSLPAAGPKNAFATARVGDLSVRIPADPTAFLTADGQFHTYAIDLTKVPGFATKIHTQFQFIPSSEPVNNCVASNLSDPSCLRIDFLRFASFDAKDVADNDQDCASQGKPDGQIPLYDNCPAVYNPGQVDGDHDGVGDACQDGDGDGVVNACESCPVSSAASVGCVPPAPPGGTPPASQAPPATVTKGGGCGCDVGGTGEESSAGMLVAAAVAAAWLVRRRRLV